MEYVKVVVKIGCYKIMSTIYLDIKIECDKEYPEYVEIEEILVNYLNPQGDISTKTYEKLNNAIVCVLEDLKGSHNV